MLQKFCGQGANVKVSMHKTSVFSVTGMGLGNIASFSRHYLGNPN